MKKDITNRDDIKKMVSVFYDRLLKDDEFNKIFLDVGEIDILDHMDIMVDFWESVLFQVSKYKGDLVETHLELNQKYRYRLNQGHFNRWLSQFVEVIDEFFEGEKATGVKERALSLATIIRLKIEEYENLRKELNN